MKKSASIWVIILSLTAIAALLFHITKMHTSPPEYRIAYYEAVITKVDSPGITVDFQSQNQLSPAFVPVDNDTDLTDYNGEKITYSTLSEGQNVRIGVYDTVIYEQPVIQFSKCHSIQLIP